MQPSPRGSGQVKQNHLLPKERHGMKPSPRGPGQVKQNHLHAKERYMP
jgi:hypothetical protein